MKEHEGGRAPLRYIVTTDGRGEVLFPAEPIEDRLRDCAIEARRSGDEIISAAQFLDTR